MRRALQHLAAGATKPGDERLALLDDMREVVMDLLAFLYYRVAGFL